MELNHNKFSKKYEYLIFIIDEFKKDNKYILCRREIKISWIDRVIFRLNYWKELDVKGFSGMYKKSTFITNSIQEINDFMEWNIKRDNNS
jgi:hypothetical protein